MTWARHWPATNAFLLLFLMGGGVPAHALVTCSDASSVQVDVKPVYEDIQYDFGKSFLEVAQIAGRDVGSLGNDRHAEWPVGLSTAKLSAKLATSVQGYAARGAQPACAALKTVTIEVGMVDNIVYVAREFPQDTCAFNEILRHEMVHKEVDRTFLDEYVTATRQFFQQMATSIGVVEGPDFDAIKAQFNAQMEDKLEEFGQRMEAERIARQRHVDVPEEYARVSNACRGEIPRTLAGQLGALHSGQPYPPPVEEEDDDRAPNPAAEQN